jgi:hypothetical protein
MRFSACAWWARMKGIREGVLGRVPSWAVDESVGRFKGRERQEEALCQLSWADSSPFST